MRILLVVLAMIAGLNSAQAEMTDLGPAVGSQIPHDLTSLDQNGGAQSFETIKGEKGTILVFFRSADWCPFCQRQLIDLNKIAGDVAKDGYSLVGISYDAPETLQKFKDRRGITFTLLSDKGSAIIDAFGIRNKRYEAGHYAHGVPHPLVVITDSDGTIQNKFFRESYKDRPESQLILEALAN